MQRLASKPKRRSPMTWRRQSGTINNDFEPQPVSRVGTLPQKAVNGNGVATGSRAVLGTNILDAYRGCETVLLLDEKPILRGAVAGVLRQLGYRVLEAADSVEAKYHAHARRKIHLLIMSQPDSEVGHLELARWFTAIYPQTRILLISNSCWELNLHLDNAQEISILAQPFTPLELARMVRLLLDEAVCLSMKQPT